MMHDLELTQDEAWNIVYVNYHRDVSWESYTGIDSWVDENLAGDCQLCSMENKNAENENADNKANKAYKPYIERYDNITLRFNYVEDAVAFRLRWL
jgi:hypothetical protein